MTEPAALIFRGAADGVELDMEEWPRVTVFAEAVLKGGYFYSLGVLKRAEGGDIEVVVKDRAATYQIVELRDYARTIIANLVWSVDRRPKGKVV